MALTKVRVSTSEANNARNNLRNDLETAKGLMNDLQNIVNETSNWWEGETTKAFQQSFANGVKLFNQQLDKLDQHAAAMVKSVENQQAHDQAMAQAIKKF